MDTFSHWKKYCTCKCPQQELSILYVQLACDTKIHCRTYPSNNNVRVAVTRTDAWHMFLHFLWAAQKWWWSLHLYPNLSLLPSPNCPSILLRLLPHFTQVLIATPSPLPGGSGKHNKLWLLSINLLVPVLIKTREKSLCVWHLAASQPWDWKVTELP